MSKFSIKTSIVNGVPFPSFIEQTKYDALVDLPLYSSDVFLVTHIKSGTTWLQQIATLLKISGEKIGLDHESRHILEACPWLEVIGKEAATAVSSPRVFKTHLPYHMIPGGDPATSVAKFIYVIRNPKDVAVSLYYHARLLKSNDFDGDWDCFF
ncbi:PREDICTED: sulfotransferase 1C4-like [Amphimedon queenslandica]|uniref:Sulfotransferase domain-containing protein n=1 Tax=Amphimedon queenslandica TaxID=400682 RepID=A0AAN0JC47_AMPQE|nr:PREDICTED: sulfotransferase 1C4-like [Amphimedon queenslandica]|eukprot:XP_019854574.1 PREDICTED: sulfotransferase 1C4-like [Amphimedon queenslandica]